MTDNSKRTDLQDDDPNRGKLKPDESQEELVGSKEIEDFFQRLPGNFRWPKPNAEAVAAAVEAVQRMSGGAAAAEDLASMGQGEEAGDACASCGGLLPAGARFCVWCGIPSAAVAGEAPPAVKSAGSGQHHFHHHYHHLVSDKRTNSAVVPAETEASGTSPRGRAPGTAGASPGGRAEAGARQVVQDWVQACNTKHIDDLIELYVTDATLIRSSVPPVRSLPAIREFLTSLLEAGLGDVEMESLRLELMGDIAIDLGRCKMLVPVAMGKRREERGKYLLVLVKQPIGTWKILADSWSSDLAVNAAPEPAVRKGK